jgi:thioesterase domain-containing protein
MVPVTFFPPAAGEPSLVPLRTDGSATPLFCFHGLGGHVASFLPLAESLAESRPVYGLQAQGLGPDQQPHDRIEAMADYYLREIRQVQPCGPYLLAGWSMGGLIALEAAARLQAAGEEVALLALLDSYLSDKDLSAEDLSDGSVIRWLAPHLNLPLDKLRQLPADEQWQRIAERAKLSDGVGADEIRRLADVCKAHLAAMEAYVPRPYQGRAVLLSAQDGGGPDPRWKSLCPRLCVETVPGNHYSMLRKPHAGALAARLGACLQETAVPGPAARNP